MYFRKTSRSQTGWQTYKGKQRKKVACPIGYERDDRLFHVCVIGKNKLTEKDSNHEPGKPSDVNPDSPNDYVRVGSIDVDKNKSIGTKIDCDNFEKI